MPPHTPTAVVAFLRQFRPFDVMGEAVLETMVGRLSERFYPAGEDILGPADGQAAWYVIVKQGWVQGLPAATEDGQPPPVLALQPGESFPIKALLEHRPVTVRYQAATDTFCYWLPREDFNTLLQQSPEFRAFCAEGFTQLLVGAAQLSRGATSDQMLEALPLSEPVGSFIHREPVTCTPDTPILAALERMNEAHVGSIVILDGARAPRGILTLRDVLPRVVLPRTPVEHPVSGVMTPEPMRIEETAPAHEAAALMAQHGFSHVCVVRRGVLTGVLSERDLFAMQRVGLAALVRAISTAANTERLVEASGRVEVLIDQLLAQGVQAEPLMRIITDLNDHTTRRAIDLCVADQPVPPPAFTWLSFGSEGRREQTLRTDQDNGMLFICGEGEDADAMRERLLPLARQINETLAACGFTLCPGNIMASNPECCLSDGEWRRRFGTWLDGGVPEHLLNAAIFFDFRSLHGDAGPAEALRDWLTDKARRARGFQRLMAENALRNSPPLGLMRDFAVERGGEYPHTVDLKLQGATPFVDGARILALAHGVPATNTQARLAGLAEAQVVPAGEPAAWTESFEFLQLLRMRLHREQARRGEALHNHLDPDQLNPLERRILKEVFRQARKLQELLALNHQL